MCCFFVVMVTIEVWTLCYLHRISMGYANLQTISRPSCFIALKIQFYFSFFQLEFKFIMMQDNPFKVIKISFIIFKNNLVTIKEINLIF